MQLSQFYTPNRFSKLLVESLDSSVASSVIDIGCGQASLLNAARKRWDKAKLIGYDVDPNNTILNGENLFLNTGNGLDPDLSKKILDTFGYIDISVANPPYTQIEVNSNIRQILKLSGLYECIPKQSKKIPAEIVFLAQNLIVLKKDGELGAILPASIINGERWRSLREYLITEKSLTRVIQLPEKAFNKTEVSTFAISLKNLSNQNVDIRLSSASENSSLIIDKISAIDRLDYSYHANKKYLAHKKIELGYEIFRGKESSKDISLTPNKILHTSDLKSKFSVFELPKKEIKKNKKIAQEGDFIISRVGSRCVGKAGFIKSGSIEISDCIIVIRNLPYNVFFNYFESGNFHQKVSDMVLGTGAKYLTYKIIREALEFHEF